MDVSASETTVDATPHTTAAVVWHDLECGRYSADMRLWLDLAHEALSGARSAPILDVGAGTGRVTLALADRGHDVTAVDLDPILLEALQDRATRAGLVARSVCADARQMALPRRDFALCVMPMQTIQLLGGADGRIAFLRAAREHLLPGALLACAIVTELEPFDCTAGELGPTPEVTMIDGVEYRSQALAVRVDRRRVRIERERTITGTGGDAPTRQANVIELDRVSASELRREGREAGLGFHAVRQIAATEEHVGSEVVILSA